MKIHKVSDKCAVRNFCLKGFSLIEVLTTIAIVGVLSAIAMNVYEGTVEKSQETIADNLVETLNTSLSEFSHALWDIRTTKNDGSSDDEFLVLRSLQYDDPNDLIPGQPFMRPDWNPLASGNTDDYRLLWTGRMFKLARPGESGTGLKVTFDGTDLGTMYEFANGYQVIGRSG